MEPTCYELIWYTECSVNPVCHLFTHSLNHSLIHTYTHTHETSFFNPEFEPWRVSHSSTKNLMIILHHYGLCFLNLMRTYIKFKTNLLHSAFLFLN